MTEKITEEVKPKRTRARKTAFQKAVESDSKTVSDNTPAIYRARVTTSLLNVRERPEKVSSIVRQVEIASILDIADVCDKWLKLVGGGYVMAEFTERVD